MTSQPRERPFNPYRIPNSPAAAAIVTECGGFVLEYERHCLSTPVSNHALLAVSNCTLLNSLSDPLCGLSEAA